MKRLLVLLAASCAGDYVYAHHVSGVVLDRAGRPVAGVRVVRVDDSGASYGPLYESLTDGSGHFLFVGRGLGHRPKRSDRWILEAGSDGESIRGMVDAPWSCGSPCLGYHADVVLRPRP